MDSHLEHYEILARDLAAAVWSLYSLREKGFHFVESDLCMYSPRIDNRPYLRGTDSLGPSDPASPIGRCGALLPFYVVPSSMWHQLRI